MFRLHLKLLVSVYNPFRAAHLSGSPRMIDCLAVLSFSTPHRSPRRALVDTRTLRLAPRRRSRPSSDCPRAELFMKHGKQSPDPSFIGLRAILANFKCFVVLR